MLDVYYTEAKGTYVFLFQNSENVRLGIFKHFTKSAYVPPSGNLPKAQLHLTSSTTPQPQKHLHSNNPKSTQRSSET